MIMEKYGIILQLLAGITLGLDYFLKRKQLKRINAKLSKALSWPSSKPGRAIGISLLVALSAAGLGITLPMIIFGEADISSWEGILGTIVGAIFLICFGGIAYAYSVNFISKKLEEKRTLRHKKGKSATERDALTANLSLLLTTILLGLVLSLILVILAKTVPFVAPFVALVFAFIYAFLFPALVGSLFYLLMRALIKLLDKISKMPKGALGPSALGLFVAGCIIQLIAVW
jgi:hypothetical protein